MKSLITVPNAQLGGVYSFVNNILPYLGENVIEFKRGKSERSKIFEMFLLPLRFVKILFREKLDNIIINTSLSKSLLFRDGLLVLLSKLFNKKALLIVHGFQKSALKYKFILKQGYFRADAIIVLADEFKECLLDKGYKKNIYTQYNPVSSDILLSEVKHKDLSALNDILFISRIEKAKGIYILLDAFKVLKENHSNIKLHIAGDGTELDSVKNYIYNNNIKDVYTYGYIKGVDKINLINNTDIFIFPTYYNEGLPISVLEAMAMGQAVITRLVGGLVDLYEQCDFGAMIESLDASDYVKSFENFAEDKQRLIEIRRNNIQFAKNNFTPEVIAKRILDILKSL